MHRIDGPGYAVGNLFTAGNPLANPPIDATVITAEWLNAVQEELVGLVLAAGLSLSKPDNAQLLAALAALRVTALDLEIPNVTAPRTLAALEGVQVGDTFGVAKAAVTVGNPFTLVIGGRRTFPKQTGGALNTGEQCYWDDSNQYMTGVASGNVLAGFARSDHASGATTVDVHLTPNAWGNQ